MRFLAIFLASACLFSCGSEKKPEPTLEPGKVYLKKELSSLTTCLIGHAECPHPNDRCVEAPSYLGGNRRCIPLNKVGDFFGCTRDELVILPDEPWKLDCLGKPSIL